MAIRQETDVLLAWTLVVLLAPPALWAWGVLAHALRCHGHQLTHRRHAGKNHAVQAPIRIASMTEREGQIVIANPDFRAAQLRSRPRVGKQAPARAQVRQSAA
jgi:hypothetical protein